MQGTQFNQNIQNWITNAPRGEEGERARVADIIQKNCKEGVSSFPLQESSITSLPPLPEQITELKIKDCNQLSSASLQGNLSKLTIDHAVKLLAISGDLTQLSTLILSFCPNLKAVSDSTPQLNSIQIDNCHHLTEECGNSQISGLLKPSRSIFDIVRSPRVG